jgi:hypothetical protein
MTNEQIERGYKAAWHGLIGLTGLWETQRSRTLLGKILAWGIVAFHLDAMLADAMGVDTTPQRLLKKLRPEGL